MRPTAAVSLAVATVATVASLVAVVPAGADDLGCGHLVKGVECVLFRDEAGGLLIPDDLTGFEVGDWVRVIGTFDPSCASFCMQGSGCVHQAIFDFCPWPATRVAPPVLLRNAELTSSGPPPGALALVFAGVSCGGYAYDPATSLDPLGPDCHGEATLPGDDDDTHEASYPRGATEAEAGIVSDASRPLVFYQIDDDPPVGNRVRCVKDRRLDSVAVYF